MENEIKEKESKLTEAMKKQTEKLKSISERQLQLLKDSVPDFSQFTSSYNTNLNEIVKELEVDPAMKEISDTL